ncbi:hypothetical protein MHPYR_870001 [uncultured Mycobacterium sp.]|uniref:Uncharacterized protein n=1 Tax=uncultured Mycobacterium sp. TaxID=171292 RepID=A0A1Y5PJ67_9MYCO|nr:hypothetical protein MHPYR_610006 [uncultured Mycobacterium sp.]SBS79638.1 hypothetical protein MHPYR_870001 [uncultured Mycobacterium sp.]
MPPHGWLVNLVSAGRSDAGEAMVNIECLFLSAPQGRTEPAVDAWCLANLDTYHRPVGFYGGMPAPGSPADYQLCRRPPGSA